MPPEVKKLLFDMQRAAQRIRQFAAGRTLDQYHNDLLLKSAVERQFQILGEALLRLRKVSQPAASRITSQRDIVNFRHVLVHGYDTIRDEVVWGIVEGDLDVLHDEVDALLAEPEEPPPA